MATGTSKSTKTTNRGKKIGTSKSGTGTSGSRTSGSRASGSGSPGSGKSSSGSSGSGVLFRAFWRSQGGRLLRTFLLAVIVILVDLLISQNQFSNFFLLLGIELLVVFAFILLYLAWQQRNVDQNVDQK